MSLRDRWRERRGGGAGSDGADRAETGGGDEATDAGDGSRGPSSGRDDVIDFDPRSDGEYHCAATGLYLRFARPAVTETGGAPGTEATEPARGEFTAAGRFTVQRRFGRPVVYTVLQVGDDARSLLVRRTDAADGSSAELEFAFEPDDPGSA